MQKGLVHIRHIWKMSNTHFKSYVWFIASFCSYMFPWLLLKTSLWEISATSCHHDDWRKIKLHHYNARMTLYKVSEKIKEDVQIKSMPHSVPGVSNLYYQRGIMWCIIIFFPFTKPDRGMTITWHIRALGPWVWHPVLYHHFYGYLPLLFCKINSQPQHTKVGRVVVYLS